LANVCACSDNSLTTGVFYNIGTCANCICVPLDWHHMPSWSCTYALRFEIGVHCPYLALMHFNICLWIWSRRWLKHARIVKQRVQYKPPLKRLLSSDFEQELYSQVLDIINWHLITI